MFWSFILKVSRCHARVQSSKAPPAAISVGKRNGHANSDIKYWLNLGISLVSVITKVFEKLVNNKLADQLKKYGLFSDFQFGFVFSINCRSDSCIQ